MKPLTREWVTKAEGDYATANREVRARSQPNYDAVCFHAQQCAEKYLKALLQEDGLVIPRTHHLEAIAKPLLAIHPALSELTASFRTLTAFAVETRYPGKSSTRTLAKEAMTHYRKIRSTLRREVNSTRFRQRRA